MTRLDQATAAVDGWLTGLPSWQAFLVVVGGSLLAAALVQIGGDRVVRRLTARIPGEVDDVVFDRVHPALWSTVVLAGTAVGVAQLDLVDARIALVWTVTLTVVTVIWAVTLGRLGREISEAVTDSGYVDRKVVPIVQNVWAAAVGLVAAFVVLSVWRVDVTPLLASAGVVGIVVGLAARDTLANFFGSLSLYADGTYAVGDYVVLATGERGRVEDVSVRSTVVRTRDDVLVTVPNAKLSNESVVNESAPRSHRRVRVPVGVAYGSDPDEVEAILAAVAEDEGLLRDHPAPRVRFRGFGDSALDVELLGWIDDPRLRGRATDRLVRAVYEAFRAADVEIPYPQRDVRVSGSGAGADAAASPASPAGDELPGAAED